jgi:hypothetical protein
LYIEFKLWGKKCLNVETFKIIHKNSPSYRHDLINIKLQNYNFRSQETTVLPRVRTTRYGLKSSKCLALHHTGISTKNGKKKGKSISYEELYACTALT